MTAFRVDPDGLDELSCAVQSLLQALSGLPPAGRRDRIACTR